MVQFVTNIFILALVFVFEVFVWTLETVHTGGALHNHVLLWGTRYTVKMTRLSHALRTMFLQYGSSTPLAEHYPSGSNYGLDVRQVGGWMEEDSLG